MVEAELTPDEHAAERLLAALLRVKERYKLTPSDARWIIKCCGLTKAARSLVRKAKL